MVGTKNKFVFFPLISLAALIAACQENKTNSPPIFKADMVSYGGQTKVEAVPIKRETPKTVLVDENTKVPSKNFRAPKDYQFKIGVLLPLSGNYSNLGRSLLRSMELAFFELGSETQTLLIFDTMGTSDGARNAANSAIRAGAKILVGPLFSAPSLAVASEKIGESLMSISLSNDPNAVAPDAFVMGLLPANRVQRVVSYAAAQNLRRFAALLPDDRYGDIVGAAFKEAVAKVGGTVIRIERYSRGQQETVVRAVKRLARYSVRKNALKTQKLFLGDMKDPKSVLELKRLNDLEIFGVADFDVVLLTEKGTALTALAPLLPYYEIDIRKVRIIGIEDWDEQTLFREPALNRAWYAAPSSRGLKVFEQKYRINFGVEAHRLGPLAYDAMAVAIFLGGSASSTIMRDSLTNPAGFLGSAGLFRFQKDGVVERNYSIFEVGEEGVSEISSARESFVLREVN